jgi:hypothetical protein
MGYEISKAFSSGPAESPGLLGNMALRRAEKDALVEAGVSYAGHQLDLLHESLDSDLKNAKIRLAGARTRTATTTIGECIDAGIEEAAGNEYKAHHINKILERGSEIIRGLV